VFGSGTNDQNESKKFEFISVTYVNKLSLRPADMTAGASSYPGWSKRVFRDFC